MWIYDFDGVLMDSLDEVTVTAYNAVTEKMVKALEDIPSSLVKLFKRNRFHFQPAGDVLPLMQWSLDTYLAMPDKVLTREEFLDIIRTTAEPLVSRTERFYAARARFIRHDSQHWLSLNRPFQPIWNELIKQGSEHVVILTNKNREAVFKQCRSFGLNISEENIYAGDGGATKTSNLNTIKRRFDNRLLNFIDDSLKNLQELDASFNKFSKKLSLYFASWGFIGPEDIATARSFGFPVLSQNDFIKLISKETKQP